MLKFNSILKIVSLFNFHMSASHKNKHHPELFRCLAPCVCVLELVLLFALLHIIESFILRVSFCTFQYFKGREI